MATVTPTNATNMNVTWSSSDLGVATVDNTGKVTGVATGKVTITATTADEGLTATCIINITNNIYVNETFNFAITGNYLTTPLRTVTITYNSGDVQLLDLCGFTCAQDTMTSGPIPGTNITITQNTAGTISFTVILTIPNGKSWSGVLNMIKFHANVSNPSISYSVQ